jgi:hypothetical protein
MIVSSGFAVLHCPTRSAGLQVLEPALKCGKTPFHLNVTDPMDDSAGRCSSGDDSGYVTKGARTEGGVDEKRSRRQDVPDSWLVKTGLQRSRLRKGGVFRWPPYRRASGFVLVAQRLGISRSFPAADANHRHLIGPVLCRTVRIGDSSEVRERMTISFHLGSHLFDCRLKNPFRLDLGTSVRQPGTLSPPSSAVDVG